MRNRILGACFAVFTAAISTASIADPYEINSLKSGDMDRLVVHSEPKSVSNKTFELEDYGGKASLQDWSGKFVVLNIWATWCPPCRKEMPMLSSLQAELGGDAFEVVTIATGREDPRKIEYFFNEIGVGNLPMHRDPSQQLARELGVFGLPTTIIIDPEGKEIARMRGDANWNSTSSQNIVKTLLSTR